MADVPEQTAFDLALHDLKALDVALAAASANRILMDFLVKVGVNRDEMENVFRDKAGELIARQYEDNAANLLRMMANVSSPRRPDE